MRIKKILTIQFYILFILLSFIISPSLYAETAVKDVEVELICQCDEHKCRKMLSNCECKFSDQMRAEIATKLKDGLTKDEILAFYIGKYGEQALSAPTKKGFNILAWITPFIALATGFIILFRIVSDWVKKRKDDNNTPQGGGDSNISSNNLDSKYMDKMNEELKRFDS